MKKNLTVAVIERIKPAFQRQEIADAGAKGLYLIVQPSGSKSWAMRFRKPDGNPTKLTLGSFNPGKAARGAPVMGGPLTLAEARSLSADINRMRASGTDVVSDAKAEKHRHRRIAAGETNTFAEVAQAFIQKHKVKKTGERPRGWRDVAKVLGLDYPRDGGEPTIVENGLCERWASKPIAEISGHDVHEVISEAIKDGVPGIKPKHDEASDNRGRKMGDALGSMFKWAMRHRRAAMQSNPMIGTFRPGPPPARDRVLTTAEIKSLWNACHKVAYPFGCIVKLLLVTGCRLNEIACLEWKELDRNLSVISLPGRRTKNSLPHVVHLAPAAKEIIKSAKRVEKCPYVFTITGRTPVSGWSKIKDRLDDAMIERNEGDAFPPWRFHDLRRTCATMMSEQLRVSPHIVEAALNHVSGAKAGVAGTYNRAMYLEERAAALDQWATYVEGIATGKPTKVVSITKRSK
jgi:integrase